MKKQISDKDLNAVIEMSLRENAPNMGSDEELFADVKEYFENEEDAKQTARPRPPGIRLRPAFISIGAAVVMIAIIIPVILHLTRSRFAGYIEDLTTKAVSQQELAQAVGTDLITLNIEEYTLSERKLYITDKSQTVAYSLRYNHNSNSIFVIVILNKNYLSRLNNRFAFDINEYKHNEIIISEMRNDTSGVCKFNYSKRQFFIEFTESIDAIDEVLGQIIA